MIPLDASVGELYMVNGQRQGSVPFSGAFPTPRRSARGRQDDTLFILIDAAAPHPVIPDLIQRIQQAYWNVPGGATAGLRGAIEAGNAWLIERNQLAVAAMRAGVVCAVLRGSEVFIAQAGPSCAYVAHQGQVSRFPRTAESSSQPALGIARAIDIRFSRAELQPGDVVLLTDSALPTRVPDAAVASSIVYVGVEAALDNLARLGGSETLRAMVIEVSAAEPASTVSAQPSAPAAPVARAETAVPQPPSRERAQPQPTAPQARERPRASVPVAKPSQPAPKTGKGEQAGPGWAGAIGQGLSRSVGSVGAAVRLSLQRILPDRKRRPAPAATKRVPRGALPIERNTPLMATLAIGIPIIVAILVTAVYLDRSTAAQVDALLAEARLRVTEASNAPAEMKRDRWLAAQARANEALALAPGNTAALDIRTQAQAQLDVLDVTVRVSPALLYDFGQPGQHRLATQGLTLFVLDQAANTIYRLKLAARGDAIDGPGPEQVVTKGTTVGKRQVGDLVDLVWVEAGGLRLKSALVALDRGGLIEYDPSFGPSAIAFDMTNVPPGLYRLDTYGGNLYLLDVTKRQVWRYLPATDGYPGQPESYFSASPPGIEKAVDMAIDGRVYLLEANGTLHKYLQGEEEPFAPTGLLTPIRQPVALAVDPAAENGSHVYVAALDGARVVQLAADGKYVRQVRATGSEFDAIEDLLVDERAGRLYVISGGRLYTAALPTSTTP